MKYIWLLDISQVGECQKSDASIDVIFDVILDVILIAQFTASFRCDRLLSRCSLKLVPRDMTSFTLLGFTSEVQNIICYIFVNFGQFEKLFLQKG